MIYADDRTRALEMGKTAKEPFIATHIEKRASLEAGQA
ncbi:hypothetical protein TI01_0889 [Lysobacter sp. A03]|nr:hypothetical protein TI01_0889 [Lysobacter sp. A03]